MKRYVVSLIWLSSEKLYRLILGLTVTALVVRYLGAELFGELSYSYGCILIAASFGGLGVESVFVRELINKEIDRPVLIASVLFIKTIGVVFSAIIVLIFYVTTDSQLTKGLILIISLTQLYLPFAVLDNIFQSKVKARSIALPNLLAFSVSSLVKILLVEVDASVYTFALMYVIESTIIAGLLALMFLKENEKINPRCVDFSVVKKLLKRCWPIFLSVVFATISLKVDQIIIHHFLDSRSVGLYAASIKLAEVFYFIPVVITVTIFPKLVESSSGSSYQNTLVGISSLLTWLALGICVVLIPFRVPVIELIFGADFILSGDLLLYHLLALFSIFQYSLRKKALIVEGKENFVLYYSIGTAVLLLSSLVALIAMVGIRGAAIGHLVGWAASLTLLPVILQRPGDLRLLIASTNPINILRLIAR